MITRLNTIILFTVFAIFILFCASKVVGQIHGLLSDIPLVRLYPHSYNNQGTPWDQLQTDSIEWLVRNTYEVDPNIPQNKIFMTADTPLTHILCYWVMHGQLLAYNGPGDSFNQVLGHDKFLAIKERLFVGGPENDYFRIIEDWVSIKPSHRKYRYILAIAPEIKNDSGAMAPVFWIYYPHVSIPFTHLRVNQKLPDTWKSIFDNHNFVTRLISTADTLRFPDVVHDYESWNKIHDYDRLNSK